MVAGFAPRSFKGISVKRSYELIVSDLALCKFGKRADTVRDNIREKFEIVFLSRLYSLFLATLGKFFS